MSPCGKEYQFHPINENPVNLDFADCQSIHDVHMVLKHKVGLPNFYGENWNALWDLLWDVWCVHEPLMVQIKNFHCMPKDLREYCEEGMFDIFEDIHNKFPYIIFKRLS